MRIGVIGAGPGGLAIAGHAALHDFEVRLHDLRDEAVAPIRARGGVTVQGKEAGFGRILDATTDIAPVARTADVIVLAVPGPQQGAAALALAPHVKPAQLVLVKPGGTGGALEVAAALHGRAARGVLVAETDAFAYGCSIPKAGVVSITSVKNQFRLAALPARRTADAVAAVRPLFPEVESAPTVLHTSLTNINAILHVGAMVTNAGWIEHARGTFEFYGEGITPAVARLVDAVDRERLNVARRLDVEVPSLPEWIRTTYGVSGPDLYSTIQVLHRDVYRHSPAPPALAHRYLTEDVPCGAVPVASLGRQLGADVSVTAACADLACVLTGQPFWTAGRTVERLGLAGLSAAEIRERVA